jgi:CXXX repeat radical SAM target protein
MHRNAMRKGRRAFLRSGIVVLPALATLGLAMIALPQPASADCGSAECSDKCHNSCKDDCMDRCYKTCFDTCSGTCDTTCSGTAQQ